MRNNKDWGKIERSLSVAVSHSTSEASNERDQRQIFVSSPHAPVRPRSSDELSIVEHFQEALRCGSFRNETSSRGVSTGKRASDVPHCCTPAYSVAPRTCFASLNFFFLLFPPPSPLIFHNHVASTATSSTCSSQRLPTTPRIRPSSFLIRSTRYSRAYAPRPQVYPRALLSVVY